MRSLANKTKKIFIGLAGSIVVLVGIIAIPYPGPGWLIVFAGLTILATEFDWAKDVHDFVHAKYNAWLAWIRAQHTGVKLVFWLLTFIIAVLLAWVLNGYGLLNAWLNLGQEWLNSPFVKQHGV